MSDEKYLHWFCVQDKFSKGIIQIEKECLIVFKNKSYRNVHSLKTAD